MTDGQKEECSRGYKDKRFSIITVSWWWIRCCSWHTTLNLDFWNCWTNLGFCCPCFSLLHGCFCSVVSGAHVAICFYLHFFLHPCRSSIQGRWARKGERDWGVPLGTRTLCPGLFAALWLAEPPWASLSSWHQGHSYDEGLKIQDCFIQWNESRLAVSQVACCWQLRGCYCYEKPSTYWQERKIAGWMFMA